jgi:hypothetical protein
LAFQYFLSLNTPLFSIEDVFSWEIYRYLSLFWPSFLYQVHTIFMKDTNSQIEKIIFVVIKCLIDDKRITKSSINVLDHHCIEIVEGNLTVFV